MARDMERVENEKINSKNLFSLHFDEHQGKIYQVEKET